MKCSRLFIVPVLVLAFGICVLYFNSLTFKIQKAVWGKDCTVTAAVIYNDYIWSYNSKKAPLLSVFKYFAALKVLNKIKAEKCSLDDKILVTEDMVSKTTYSPMLKKYAAPFKISVADLMKYMVSESDNNAADILIEYAGGIEAIRSFLQTFDFDAIEISANEKMMNEDIGAQYLNKARAFDVLLAMKFFRETTMPDEQRAFLDKIMIKTVTGEDKIKAGLPEGVVFGHKTGSSSRKPDGVKIADNDAGFVILPNGKTCYMAVFVTESKMSDKENAALISEISRIIYDEVNRK